MSCAQAPAAAAQVGDRAEFFAGAASEWDKLRGELYGHAFSTAALLALLPRNMVVADLGCGTGVSIEPLASHVKQIIGIDNSPAMLKAAKKRLAKFPNVDLRKGELRARRSKIARSMPCCWCWR